jgi:hypothetical protein
VTVIFPKCELVHRPAQRFRALSAEFIRPYGIAVSLNPYVRSRALQSKFTGRTATMNSHIDEGPKIGKTTWKQRLSNVCFLTAITVAMVGWLSAFGWVTAAVAKWLLD